MADSSRRGRRASTMAAAAGCALAAGCSSLAPPPMPPPMPTPTANLTEATLLTRMVSATVSEEEISDARIDVRAVVPLFRRDGAGVLPMCTGSFVRPGIVMTAAHCLGAADLIGLDGSGAEPRWPIVMDPRHVACVGGFRGAKCEELGALAVPPHDVATIFTEEADVRPPLRVGRIATKIFPQMFLVGFAGRLGPPKVRAVCHAVQYDLVPHFVGEQARPTPGDSGGALLAVEQSTQELVLLGVLHGSADTTREWQFSPVPRSVPMPAGVDDRPDVEDLPLDAFLDLPQCTSP